MPSDTKFQAKLDDILKIKWTVKIVKTDHLLLLEPSTFSRMTVHFGSESVLI